MTQKIEKPIRPADDDCCGGSCNTCVWDGYFEKLQKYRLEQTNLNELQVPLSP